MRAPGSRAGKWAALALAVAAAASGTAAGGGAGSSAEAQKRMLLVKGATVAAIATSRHYLTWERAPLQGQSSAVLMERDGAGKARRLTIGAVPEYGLASTSARVVYARERKGGVELVAIRHDGADPVVLTRSLAAPIASREELVAWAETSGSVQRVVVLNTATGHSRIAVRLPRCRTAQRCYRIDAVALADGGVVVARDALGSYASLIVRRSFGGVRPEVAAVPNDPQPNLAPSSAGALYFWFRHGWVRWDFTQRRPRLTSRRRVWPWLLEYRQGSSLLLAGSRCRQRLIVQPPRRPSFVVAAPVATPSSAKNLGPLCRLVNNFVWEDRRLVVSWSVLPKASIDAHIDIGLIGVVTSNNLP